MSRTFAHRPRFAWLYFPDVCVPRHDHAAGPCDLPARPALDAAPGRPGRCTWDVDDYRIPPGCGCRMCTDHNGRREARRRDRREARRALQRGLDE